MGRSQHSKSALSQFAHNTLSRWTRSGGELRARVMISRSLNTIAALNFTYMTDKQLALPLFTMASFDAVAIAHTAEQPVFQMGFAVLLLVSFALGFIAAFGEEENER